MNEYNELWYALFSAFKEKKSYVLLRIYEFSELKLEFEL